MNTTMVHRLLPLNRRPTLLHLPSTPIIVQIVAGMHPHTIQSTPSNSAGSLDPTPPGGPTTEIDWSFNQARLLRRNLNTSGPRPNPQGSYHYGLINTTRTIRTVNSAPVPSLPLLMAVLPLLTAILGPKDGVFKQDKDSGSVVEADCM
ncbi:hypothetical protein L1887_43257 [Cichorium endivia]|nr:hypothetical protein L1887_43257 [Cichorium endivia]